jgi:hypothetical protein
LEKETRVARLLGAIAAVALALSMVGGAFAATNAGTSPSSAPSLTGTGSGSFTGASDGSFNYFTFDYPSGSPTGTLTLSFSPSDPATSNAVGVDLWQNGSMIASMNGTNNPPGSRSMTFSSPSAGPILVQVYNYAPGTAVDYQVSLSGISTTSSTSGSSSNSGSSSTSGNSSTAPSSNSSTPVNLTGPMSGSLAGNPGGAYNYYMIPSFSGGTGSVTVSFSPDSWYAANGFYVVFYQNGTQIGSAQGLNTGTPGTITASYSSGTSGPVLVQVGNYTPNTTVSYTITP